MAVQMTSWVFVRGYIAVNNNFNFIIGSGTKLIVKPNLDNAEPSIYKLKPAKEGTEDISACLFTDYFPGNISVGTSPNNLEGAKSSIVVMKENEKDQGSYGTVLWGPTDDNFQCSAAQGSKTFTDETNADAGDCVKRQGTTPGPTPDVAPPPTFETDEQLNLLSLTVLGLRIIFFKSVAFNLLFTFRLWSS
ncbi:T cell receptor alpha chain MC.7.G5-like [Elgaria multicarinata webbii]|uniref:T cell receptor alpha chain MC.7.G5-like n=1 Tax=Elgaria multicarinata webbii TaxID=159646 RepID=UPI002FCD15FB